MPGASRSIVIDATPEKIFETLSNYEKYGEFLPEVKKARVSSRNGSTVEVQYEVNLMKNIKYTLRMTEEKPKRITWTFVQGEVMKDNTGSWILEPAGTSTKVTYNIEIVLGPLIPKSIVNTLVEGSLPKMLEAFKKRVEGK
jgi:coenzyme Q-binding protein COQ10